MSRCQGHLLRPPPTLTGTTGGTASNKLMKLTFKPIAKVDDRRNVMSSITSAPTVQQRVVAVRGPRQGGKLPQARITLPQGLRIFRPLG
jgi:hypothetical protein